jgi:hypothetical protein
MPSVGRRSALRAAFTLPTAGRRASDKAGAAALTVDRAAGSPAPLPSRSWLIIEPAQMLEDAPRVADHVATRELGLHGDESRQAEDNRSAA